jgi:hypothetical protein
MVILWGETENAQRPSVVRFQVFRVCLPKQTCDRELSALDPDPSRLIDTLERHQATVCTRDESVRIVEVLNRPSLGFEFPGKCRREKMSVGSDDNGNRRTGRRTR